MSVPTLTNAAIATLRCHALGVVDRPFDSASDVARHLLALQGQDWRASRWALASRMSSAATLASVHEAFDAGVLVRSWPMRGTVHVTLAEDLPWLLKLTGVRALMGVERRWAHLGIDEAWLDRAGEVTRSALQGGRSLSRAELGDVLTAAGMDVGAQRMYHVVWYLAQTGLIVLGPLGDDAEPRIVLLDEWIPTPRQFASRAEALGELARRYIGSHGPASEDDLVWWTKLTKGDVRIALAEAGDAITRVDDERGRALWVSAALLNEWDAATLGATSCTRALAPFDEHLLGYADRSAVLDPQHATAVDPARNGVFRATIVEGGRVTATWKATRRSGATRVDVTPLRGTASAAALRRARNALESWAAFHDLTLTDVRIA